MSETPQEILQAWLVSDHAPWPFQVREAIRAVLAQLRQAEILGDQAEQELEQAEAEVERLREKLGRTMSVTSLTRRVEQAEAEVERLRLQVQDKGKR